MTAVKIWLCFDNLGPNYGGKGGFWGLSHFFCGKVNIIIPYGHFFSSYGFETLHRLSRPLYGLRVKMFCDFVHSGPNYGEKGFVSKVGLSHFFHIFCVKVNVTVSYMGTFLKL